MLAVASHRPGWVSEQEVLGGHWEQAGPAVYRDPPIRLPGARMVMMVMMVIVMLTKVAVSPLGP